MHVCAYVFSIQVEKTVAQTSGFKHGTLMLCKLYFFLNDALLRNWAHYKRNHVHLINCCKNIIIQIGINEPIIKDLHRELQEKDL